MIEAIECQDWEAVMLSLILAVIYGLAMGIVIGFVVGRHTL